MNAEATSLISCVYASTSVRNVETRELTELLKRAREKNERLGLTGMLLFAEGSFFQVLEGPADVVDALYRVIEDDPRHTSITKIIREPIERRSFADWTMGFSQIEPAEVAGIVGVNDFFGQGSCFAKLSASRARKLLGTFAEGRWRKTLGGRR